VDTIAQESYLLRSSAARGTNVELAKWVAAHYGELVGKEQSAYYDLNLVLVGCGTDAVFADLLDRFPTMAIQAQQSLGYAVGRRGDPWIGRFQQKAFAKGDYSKHHHLHKFVSSEISDETARAWIKTGPEVLGWRVLIARHGNDVLDELLRELPEAFDGLDVIPPLKALGHLPNPPDDLADALWARVRGTLRPQAGQDLLYALAPIRNRGIPSVIARLARDPESLPSFHLFLFLNLFRSWQAATGLSVRVVSSGSDVPLVEWLLLKRLPGHGADSYITGSMNWIADLAVPVLLSHFEENREDYLGLLIAAGKISQFHRGVVECMLANPKHVPLIPKLFASAFDSFPEEVLLRVLDAPQTEFGDFVRALSESPSAAHKALHARTIASLFQRPFEISHYRYVARALRTHPRWALQEFLKGVLSRRDDREMWLIRETEAASGERLIDETGAWLS
jgi:hypothetical protein